MGNYPKIPEEQYKKALFHLRAQVEDVMSIFDTYDLKPFIRGAVDEMVELAEQFGKVVRNHDVPIVSKPRVPRRPRDGR